MFRGRRRLRRLWYALVTVSAVALASSAPAAPARAATTFVVLQMNLCNSGMAKASCYSFGRAVDEVRTWTCTTVIAGRLTGCTTHLSTDPDVAVRQCRELVSLLASPWVMPEVIVGGDFNLRSEPGKPHDVEGCAPAGYDRRGDDS